MDLLGNIGFGLRGPEKRMRRRKRAEASHHHGLFSAGNVVVGSRGLGFRGAAKFTSTQKGMGGNVGVASCGEFQLNFSTGKNLTFHHLSLILIGVVVQHLQQNDQAQKKENRRSNTLGT